MTEETQNGDPQKNEKASPPVEVAPDQAEASPVVPQYEGVPEDDKAEPEDADVQHKVSAKTIEKNL